MLRLTLRNLRANITRLLATATAVITGTAFVAAALMLTTAIGNAVEGNVELQYGAVDVAIEPFQSDGASSIWTQLPTELVEQVEALPGVAGATGEIVQSVEVLDDDGDPVRTRALGRVWPQDEELNANELVEGRGPQSRGEVVLDRDSAEQAGVVPGDSVRLATPSGAVESQVVGITEFGRSASVDPGGTVFFEPGDALEILTGDQPGWQQVLVRAEDGREAEVLDAVASLELGNVQVMSGESFRDSQVADTQDFIEVIRPVLVGFAFLALFVAGFVINNTFTVVVTQRTQELALVRSIGGTPAQVRRSLFVEGVVLGFLSSVTGLAVGALLALGIQALLARFELPLPGSGVAITPRVVLITVVAGTVITALSVVVPAFRAGRTRPVEAMREVAVDRSGTSRFRLYAGGALLGAALAVLLTHRFLFTRWWVLAPGVLLLFAGIVVGGPLLARLFGHGLRRLFGRSVTGKLAAENLARNPKRTATTANALVIGLFLVTFVTVSGTAVRDWVQDQFRGRSTADFVVMGSSPISDDLVEAMREVDGVRGAAAVRFGPVLTSNGEAVELAGTDVAALQESAGVSPLEGSLDAVAAGEGAAVSDLESLFADMGGAEGDSGSGGGGSGGGADVQISGTTTAAVGDTVSVLDAEGAPRELEVVATFEPQFDTIFLSTVVSDELFAELAGDQPVAQVYVRAEPGQVEEVGVGLDEVLEGTTGLEVSPGNFLGQLFGDIIDVLIAAVNGLLGLSVVIALIGIVNTMFLSIHERRRELGMVRALGMTASQVRSMVRVEAVLIGVLGTLVGVGAGAFLGWVVIGSLDEIDLPIAWGRIGWIVLAGVVVSLLACVLPARRAVKLPMLEAMAAT